MNNTNPFSPFNTYIGIDNIDETIVDTNTEYNRGSEEMFQFTGHGFHKITSRFIPTLI